VPRFACGFSSFLRLQGSLFNARLRSGWPRGTLAHFKHAPPSFDGARFTRVLRRRAGNDPKKTARAQLSTLLLSRPDQMSGATHVYIVGAGFSRYAGLPLQAAFTEALLEPRKDKGALTKPLVDHLADFINRAFDHKRSAAARYWPNLEDVFTSIDLAANTGHHLGANDPPSVLRTTRRVLLAQTMWMLNERYVAAEASRDRNWKKLDRFFQQIPIDNSAFISLNWDTVIERGLARVRGVDFFDYGCGAIAAQFPTGRDIVQRRKTTASEKRIRVVKIHGSVMFSEVSAAPDRALAGIRHLLLLAAGFIGIRLFAAGRVAGTIAGVAAINFEVVGADQDGHEQDCSMVAGENCHTLLLHI